MPGPGYPMMVGYPMMAPPQLAHVGPLLMPGTGSIRSVQSVPMLSAAGHMPGHHTWDGEPCPVHHHHQHPMVPLAALYGEQMKVMASVNHSPLDHLDPSRSHLELFSYQGLQLKLSLLTRPHKFSVT